MLSKNHKQGVLGVIVAYNPDIELLVNNIKISIKQVNEIIIVNNSDYPIDLDNYNLGNVKIINNNINLGISKALNIGIDHSRKHNYKYVLLLDQDSTLTNNFIENMILGFGKDSVGMICPNVVYIDGKNKKINEYMDFEKIELGITSGSLLNMEILEKIKFKDGKLFNEDFFIDYVDFDFSLTIRLNGFNILRANNSKLYHKLGDVKTYKIGNMEVYPTNHNYVRRYYITRNRLYMWKKYMFKNSKYVAKDVAKSVYEIILIALYEEDKKNKFKSIFKGTKDFLRGKVGEMKND